MSLNNFDNDDEWIKASVSATWDGPLKGKAPSGDVKEVERLANEENNSSAKVILGLIDEAKKQAKKLFQIEQDIDDKISKLDKEEDNFRKRL